MVQMGMIKTVMDLLYKPDSSITQLLVMLLVNLTQLDDGISSSLRVLFFILFNFQLTDDERIQGLYLMKLVRSFCRSFSETSGRFFFFPVILNFILLENDTLFASTLHGCSIRDI
ncbi:hypothetical protein Patl1_15916 [Pistacia atlantica]|nr:hypothetical protein Patl1_15916 [Pistacia atlantica]